MDLKERGESMRTFFNEEIGSYDNIHAKFSETKKMLTDHLPQDAKRVIDLGCGTGLELIPMFERFPNLKVTAVDISENMLAALNDRPFASNVTSVCDDFFITDFGNDFDAAVSTAALHHFTPDDKLRLYRKIYGCLKPGGVFLNADKTVDTPEHEIRRLKNYETEKLTERHYDTPLCRETEIRLLTEAGFTGIDIIPAYNTDYYLFSAFKA